jgi:hypothetical protein
LDGWIRGGAAVEGRKLLHLSFHPSSHVRFERDGRTSIILTGGRSWTLIIRDRPALCAQGRKRGGAKKERTRRRKSEREEKEEVGNEPVDGARAARRIAIGL